MADRLICRIALSGIAAAMFLAWLPPAALADSPDPTRPADFAAPAGAVAAPAGLQAVLLRPKGGSVAVINGQTVAVGERVGDARLVSLSANEAVLVGPNGREVLRLAPAAEKKQSMSAVPAVRGEKGTSGRGKSHD